MEHPNIDYTDIVANLSILAQKLLSEGKEIKKKTVSVQLEVPEELYNALNSLVQLIGIAPEVVLGQLASRGLDISLQLNKEKIQAPQDATQQLNEITGVLGKLSNLMNQVENIKKVIEDVRITDTNTKDNG